MSWEEVQLFDHAEATKRGYLGIWTRPAERMKAKRYVFRSFSYWKQLSKVKQSCHVQLCHTMGHALLG